MNTTYKLQLETLSPIHIGAGQEKYWQRGLDYYYKDKKIYILNQKKILLSLSPQERSNFNARVSTGKGADFLSEFFSRNKPSDFSDFVFHSDLYPQDDIRSFIRNGTGQPYIPGSSLKGAIRSAIFSHIYRNESKRTNIYNERDVFGDITNNLMHFIQVSDSLVNQKDLNIFHTKTFNLQNNAGDWKAGWKHKNGTTPFFSSNEFVFTYEAIDIDSKLLNPISISFDSDLIGYIKKTQSKLPNFISTFDNAEPIRRLFSIINENTKSYLEKEIEFFEKFADNNPDNNSITEKIIDLINEYILSEIDEKNDTCVLRFGQGSGFYSITGDWRFENHWETIYEPDKLNLRWNNKTRSKEPTHYKSRKTIFKFEKEEDSKEDLLVFDLFGFVKLSI